MFETKVIGYFAYASSKAVVCSGAACVITGGEEAMRRHIEALHPAGAAGHTIRKTRFGEIMRGLRLGAAYAFDEESYGRFLPLGRQEGLRLEEADFGKHPERFFTVQMGQGDAGHAGGDRTADISGSLGGGGRNAPA